MTPEQQAHIMALVNDYASEHATAHCESLYGGSKSYTKQCRKDADEARAAVEAALRDEPQAEQMCACRSIYFKQCGRQVPATPSAPTAVEPRVIDKSELKRLVTQVFGDDFQIVRQAAVEPVPKSDFQVDWERKNGVPMNSRRRDDGRYGDSSVQSAREAWQGSAPTAVEPDERAIERTEVVSAPGAAITVTKLHLTQAGRDSLTANSDGIKD